MSTPTIKVKVFPKAVIKGKMDVRFPASVTGAGGISVVSANGGYTISPDAGVLGDVVGPESNVGVPGKVAIFADKHHIGASVISESDLSASVLAPEYGSVAEVGATSINPNADWLRTTGYYEPGDGGGALYARALSEPSHSGKIQSLDDAWWEIAESDTLSVRAFGVVCDGDTANASSNRTILNAILSEFSGKTFVLPSGSVTVIDARINISTGGITLTSDGAQKATIKTTSLTDDIIRVNVAANILSEISVSNIILDSTVTKTAGVSLNLRATAGGALYRSTFRDIETRDSTFCGIALNSGFFNTFENIKIFGVGANGFGLSFAGIDSSNIVGNVFLININVSSSATPGGVSRGIYIADHAEGIYGTNIILESRGLNQCLYIANPSGTGGNEAPKNIWFTQLIADAPTNQGMYIEFVRTLRCIGCWTTSSLDAGVTIVKGVDIEFVGHAAIANATYGVHLNSAVKNFRYLGGVIDGNASYGALIDANTTDFKFVGTDFKRSGTTPASSYDIYIATGSSDNYDISHNNLNGSITGSLFDGGSGTNKTILGNISATFPVANKLPTALTAPGFVGPLTGSVTGNVTGNASTATLAASATALATARAIYGNNFDGTAALTQIIASTYGGTGNGFTKFTGPTTSEKTFTLPNASATIARTDAAQTFTGTQTFRDVLINSGGTSSNFSLSNSSGNNFGFGFTGATATYDSPGTAGTHQFRGEGFVNIVLMDKSKADFTAPIKFPSFTFATLPSGSTGLTVFCSNVRVFNGAGTQEGSGAGTGGLVTHNGTAWKIAGTNVTAVA